MTRLAKTVQSLMPGDGAVVTWARKNILTYRRECETRRVVITRVEATPFAGLHGQRVVSFSFHTAPGEEPVRGSCGVALVPIDESPAWGVTAVTSFRMQ